jgi:hypothetical protein
MSRLERMDTEEGEMLVVFPNLEGWDLSIGNFAK